MTILELCNVLLDNQLVSVYDSRRNQKCMLHNARASRLKFNSVWKNRDIYAIEPAGGVILLYLDE